MPPPTARIARPRSFSVGRFSAPTPGNYGHYEGQEEIPFSYEQSRQADVLEGADERTSAALDRQSQLAESDQQLQGGASSPQAMREQAIDELLRQRGIRKAGAEADQYFEPGAMAVRGAETRRTQEDLGYKAGLDTKLQQAAIEAQSRVDAARAGNQGGINRAGLTGFMNILRDRQLTGNNTVPPETTAEIQRAVGDIGGAGADLDLNSEVAKFKAENPGADFRALLANFQQKYNWDDLGEAERQQVVQQLGGQGFR